MPTAKDLSIHPPPVLRAALERAEKRVEAEKLRQDILRLQKRLREIEEGLNAQWVGRKEDTADRSQRKADRLRIDLSSLDNDEGAEEEYCDGHIWSLVEAQKVGSGPAGPEPSPIQGEGGASK